MKTPFALSNRKSFTLIEILVVMIIILTLSATLVPAAQNLFPGWRLSNSSRLVINKIRQAQEEAVSSQKRHIIRFNTAAAPPTFSLIKDDGGETVIENHTLENGISISLEAAITDNQVAFSSDGSPNTNGNITVSLSGKSKVINISPAGNIKLLP